MSAVNSDIQKLSSLLNSATNARQRKMYQTLLDKARERAKSVEFTDDLPKSQKSTAHKVDTVVSTIKQERSKSISSATLPKIDDANDLEVINNEVKPHSAGSEALRQEVSLLRTQTSSNQKSDGSLTIIFQAVGLIECTPQVENDRLSIAINANQYELRRTNGPRSQQFDLLKQEIEKNGSRQMQLRVYPNIIHDSNKQEIRHLFSLVRAYADKPKCLDSSSSFVFRGIWQYVPYCSTPVISIHRNIDTLKFYKRLSLSAKRSFIRPQAFPVVWDAPVKPFRYNPELKKSEQMPRYFVEVRAVFQDNQYTVVEMLNEPTLKIPKYIKPLKKNRNTLPQQKNS